MKRSQQSGVRQSLAASEARARRAATTAEAWRGYKRRSFALLALAEGDTVLDVGCGAGEDARELARLVPGVAVIGVDAREEAVAEARRQTLGIPRPIEFRVGDACRLDFEDAAFDACRADRVFHHLAEPGKALAEMIRVARPGGRVVVSDTDYETLVVDAPDPGVTRRIVTHHADRMESGRVGRALWRLFRDAGLRDVEVAPYAAIATAYDEEVLKLREKAERAAEAGVIAPEDAARWLASLEEADRAGGFFCALTTFTVRGRRP
jgi:ubiquinone/menaquinone biosynthesis C-methylase UbiE